MTKKTHLIVSVLLLALLLAACTPKETPSPAPSAPAAPAASAPVPAVSSGPGKPAWEAEWEKVLAEAKKEANVVVCTTIAGEPRRALVNDLKKTYGLNVEAVSGRITDMVARIKAERRAGLYLWDIDLSAGRVVYTDWEPAGALAPVDQALILPEVADPATIKKVWYRGELWWSDPQHMQLIFIMFPYPPMAINTNMVKPGEIKSYNDLLDPKWKGKMVMDDQAVLGSTFGSFLKYTFGVDWVRKLAANEPTVLRDQRLQGDWLARGKVPIALAIKADVYAELKHAGAPIEVIVPAEGTWLSAGSGGVKMFNHTPHPNAAKVFINRLLTREVQTTFSRLYGGQSVRDDVPTDFLESWQIRQSGVKYWEKERKDVLLSLADDMPIFKEIFAPVTK